MRQLAGKTALVTGAARGIGRAIALRLASRGVRLMLADRDAVGLAQTYREVLALGAEAHRHLIDLAVPGEVEGLAGNLLGRWAGVDLLVNNAGVAYYGPTDRMEQSEIEGLLAVNLHAPIRLTRALLPALLARPEAHVLNVCSVLGLAAMPKVSLYCASKYGLVGFSDALRAEYGRRGLGVTSLCPGFVLTELVQDAGAATSDRPQRQPPKLFCVSLEQVAKAAVKGVERNRRQVVVDPVGRWVRGAMGLAPDLFDWMHSLGRAKRVAKKHAHLESLAPDRDAALRLQLGIPAAGKPSLAA